MESVDLDMGEIFDEHEEGEDIGALPDLPDNTQDASQDPDEAENAEVLARLQKLSKGAAKKVVRRPQPKLDPTRLTGDRGIPILPKLFEKVKFKGKGHEASDLAVIMRHMEHWGHRLFPKMPFDEVIERVEKLGTKKPVQTCVKKIRLDMPILDDDFVGSDREDRPDDVNRNSDMETDKVDRDEDMWEEMLREEEEIRASQAGDTSNPAEDRLTDSTSTSRPIDTSHTAEDRLSNGASESGGAGPEFTATRIDTPSKQAQNPAENGCLTPDQLARIERNKQLALERRLKKAGMSMLGTPKT